MSPSAVDYEWRPKDHQLRQRDFERRLIEHALTSALGNRRRAALLLGVTPATLRTNMDRLGIIRADLGCARVGQPTPAIGKSYP